MTVTPAMLVVFMVVKVAVVFGGLYALASWWERRQGRRAEDD